MGSDRVLQLEAHRTDVEDVAAGTGDAFVGDEVALRKSSTSSVTRSATEEQQGDMTYAFSVLNQWQEDRVGSAFAAAQ